MLVIFDRRAQLPGVDSLSPSASPQDVLEVEGGFDKLMRETVNVLTLTCMRDHPYGTCGVAGFAKVGVKDVLEGKELGWNINSQDGLFFLFEVFQRAGKPTAEASKLNEEIHEIQTQPDSRRPRMLQGAGHRKIPSFPNHCLNALW